MLTMEILCTTMHQTDFSKIKEMNVHSDIVFANQCDDIGYAECSFEGKTAKMVSTNTRGVGKNRNVALLYATGDICLFADDDVEYNDSAEKQVLGEFEKHPDADVIIFHFESDHPTRKPPKYSKTKKWKSFRLPWGAIRIAVKREAVLKKDLWFNVLFGGGCIFPSGEDSIWLRNAKNAGLTFYVSKETIGKVSYAESTWFDGYNEKYYYGIGACYEAINPGNMLIKSWVRAFLMRKNGDLSFFEKLKWMKNGKDGFQKMLSYDEYTKNIKY